MRAAIYARVSTEKQSRKSDSTDQQRRVCLEKAEALGLTCDSAHYYCDEGISGSRTDRPAYLKMLEAAKARQFDALIVSQQSRLGRDSMEAEKCIRRLEQWNVRLVTCDGYDSHSGPKKQRKLLRGVKGLMDEATLSDIAENVHRTMVDRARDGYWLGARPFGYQLVAEYDPVRVDAAKQPVRLGVRLAIDPKEAAIVREIFDRLEKLQSVDMIAKAITAQGIPAPGVTRTRKDGEKPKGWHAIYINRMLRSPLYKGLRLWNTTEWQKDEDSGRRMPVARPEADWIKHDDPKLAIVKPAQWARVNARLDAAKAARGQLGKNLKHSGRGPKYLLSSILRCEQCGAKMEIGSSGGYYLCSTYRQHSKAACSYGRNVNRLTAEDNVLRDLLAELRDPRWLAAIEAEDRRRAQASAKAARARPSTAGLAEQLVKVQAECQRLADAVADHGLSPTLKQRLAKAEAEAQRLKAEIAGEGVKAPASVVTAFPRKLAGYAAMLEKTAAMLRKGTSTEISIVRSAIAKLVEGGEIRVSTEVRDGRKIPVGTYRLSGAAIARAVGFDYETAADRKVILKTDLA